MKKHIALLVLGFAAFGVGSSIYAAKKDKGGENMQAAKIEITKNASIKSNKGPADYFAGSVRVDPFLAPAHESGVSLAHVTFEPGARTAWHTHPKGQILIITSGLGLVQEEGKETLEVRPGDTVWFPAGVKHWHGASKDHAMTHISIVVEQDGKNADWMEIVADKDYYK